MLGIIVEAQTNADDLPDRAFYKFGKHSVVARVLTNCVKSDFAHKVILSMPSIDKSLIHGHVFQDSLVSVSGINYMDRGITTNFYGRYEEGLSRLYHAALTNELTTIVKINADNVLIPTWLINQACLHYFKEVKDNEFLIVGGQEYNAGLEIEIFQFWMLAEAHINCDDQLGLSSYMLNNFEPRYMLNSGKNYIKNVQQDLRFRTRSQVGLIGSILEEVDLGADVGEVIGDMEEGN